jgi:hypothetical protein
VKSIQFFEITRSHLKNWILVQDQGGAAVQPGGILQVFRGVETRTQHRDLSASPLSASLSGGLGHQASPCGLCPDKKDFFEMAYR